MATLPGLDVRGWTFEQLDDYLQSHDDPKNGWDGSEWPAFVEIETGLYICPVCFTERDTEELKAPGAFSHDCYNRIGSRDPDPRLTVAEYFHA